MTKPQNEFEEKVKIQIKPSGAIRCAWCKQVAYQCECQDRYNAQVKPLVEKAIREAQKQTAEDICVMLDGIELRDENTSMEQWKHYKGIRNAIRDKYVLGKSNL